MIIHNKSFFFFGEIIHTDEELPLQLFGDFYLKRATEEQIQVIKKEVDKYDYNLWKLNRYELEITECENKSKSVKPLETPNYFIVEGSDDLNPFDFTLIFALSSLNLTTLFRFSDFHIQGCKCTGSWSPFGIDTPSSYYTKNRIECFNNETCVISKKDIYELSALYQLMKDIEIPKYLMNYLKGSIISEMIPLKLILYFSILEYLLIKKGTKKIAETLHRKIEELNKKYDLQVSSNYEIKDIYRYRNDIAHGNIFNTEKFIKFIDYTEAINLISEITKQIIILDLKGEPLN